MLTPITVEDILDAMQALQLKHKCGKPIVFKYETEITIDEINAISKTIKI